MEFVADEIGNIVLPIFPEPHAPIERKCPFDSNWGSGVGSLSIVSSAVDSRQPNRSDMGTDHLTIRVRNKICINDINDEIYVLMTLMIKGGVLMDNLNTEYHFDWMNFSPCRIILLM